MNFPRNTYLQIAKAEGKSPDFIEKTLNYADDLIKKDLPVIFSLKHFSQIIGVDLLQINNIIINRGFHYSYYLIKKKRGGYRRIIAPHKDIRYLQDWIKINILDKVKLHSAANGFVQKKSILSNAQSHINADIILNIDLENFFESITEKMVYGIFKYLGYHPNLAVDFAKICTVKMPESKFNDLDCETQKNFENYYSQRHAVLVQGAPTSPGLSNIACMHLDNRITKLSNKNNFIYTRYADDITLSGKEKDLPSISLLKKIIEDEKFKINWQKVGKYKSGQRQMVTGLLINEYIRIPKRYKNEIFRHLRFCEKYGPTSHFNRIAPEKSYRKEWLMGKILYVNAIEPLIAKDMFEKFKKLNWEL